MLPEPYYADDAVTLYCARCEDILPRIPRRSIALICTSPPYNKSASLKNRRGGHTSNWQGYADRHWYGDDMTDAEYQDWQAGLLNGWADLLVDRGSICYNVKPVSKGNVEDDPRDWIRAKAEKLLLRQTIIWHSKASCQFNNGLFYPFHEYVLWLYRKGDRPRWAAKSEVGNTSVWDILADRTTDWHPCSFPVELAARCIRALSEPGELILDPFSGSGTTLMAAKMLGRRAVGIEISEEYCEKAAIRLSQMPLFAVVEAAKPKQPALMGE